MQKIGLYALLAIVVFALVFAFLPGSRTESRTGATLQGVQLRLYPARDPDAVWSFRAADVTSDPVTNETHLRTLSGAACGQGKGQQRRPDRPRDSGRAAQCS
ncbi:hypothetical protein ACFSC4_11825 [Deinococcus malanensis]|uniref:hypothetical protein n=1 Tax=Deinococcus malanensis TaxID=1706855 RepID=UPI00363889E0